MLVVILILVYLHSMKTGDTTTSLEENESFSEDCASSNYNGSISVTNGGRTCQHWSNQVPHMHTFNDISFFPLDDSMEEVENYCRSLDGDKTPWCYTTDIHMRWQYCNEIICGVSGPQCGGILTASNGTFQSIDRNGDNNYDNNNDCLWTLVAPEDKVIELNILTFELEEADNCDYDYLLVYEDSLSHGLYCGTYAPSTIKSWSQTLHVRFHSDELYGKSGFTLTFSHVLPSSDEDGEQNATSYLVHYGNTACSVDVDVLLYTGDIHITDSGTTCMEWTDTGLPDYQFLVDGSAAAAKNYCRNILGSIVPWCVSTATLSSESCVKQICTDSAKPKGTTVNGVTTKVNPTTPAGASTSISEGFWGSPVTASSSTMWWKSSAATSSPPKFMGSSVLPDQNEKWVKNKTAGENITWIYITPSIELTAGVTLSTGIDTSAGMKMSTEKHTTAGMKNSTEINTIAKEKMSTGTHTTTGINSTSGLPTGIESTPSMEASSCEKLCSRIWRVQLIAFLTFLKV